MHLIGPKRNIFPDRPFSSNYIFNPMSITCRNNILLQPLSYYDQRDITVTVISLCYDPSKKYDENVYGTKLSKLSQLLWQKFILLQVT